MDITPLIPKGRKLINAYGDGGFTIGGERVEGSVVVTPDAVLSWNVVSDAQWSESDFAAVFALTEVPEILLVGTGKAMRPLPPALRATFRSRSIAVDAMDTGAACRTYNVLLAEGRAVAAALIPV